MFLKGVTTGSDYWLTPCLRADLMTQTIGRKGYEQQIVALHSVLQQLQQPQPVESLASLTLDFLQSTFEYSLIWLALYDPTTHELEGIAGVAPSGETDLFTQSIKVLPGNTFDQVLLTGHSAEITDLQQDSRVGKWQQVARRYGIQGTLIHPLRYQAQSLGLVLMGSVLWGCNPRAAQTAQLSIFSSALAAALYPLKRPQSQPDDRKGIAWEAVLEQLSQSPDIGGKLQVVIQGLHQRIEPTHTRLYWFEPEHRWFRQRATCPSEPSKHPKRAPVEETNIELQEMGPLAQTLRAGQIVAVSDIQGTINANLPTRMMYQLQARSLLSAPILVENQLLGFVALSGAEPRVWQEAEQKSLQSATQLLGLVVGPESSTATLSTLTACDTWSPQLLSALLSPQVPPNFYQQLLTQGGSALQGQWVLLLHHKAILGQFHIEDQFHIPKRIPLVGPLAELSDIDSQMLQSSSEPIALENLEEDLRLLAWRDPLLAQEVRSLFIAPLDLGASNQMFLMVACDCIRNWTLDEREQLQQVAQALAAVQRHQQMQDQYEQAKTLNAWLHDGLIALQQVQQPQQLRPQVLQDVVNLLQVPFAALIQWQTGQDQGEVTAAITSPPDFNLTEGTLVQIGHDALLQKVFHSCPASSASNGNPVEWVQLTAADLEPATQSWLNCPHLGQLMALPLTAKGQSCGAVLVGDATERGWDSDTLSATRILVQQFAETYCWRQTVNLIQQNHQTWACRNWYKQRQLESLQAELVQHNGQVQDAIVLPKDNTVQQQRLLVQLQETVSALGYLIYEDNPLDQPPEVLLLSKLLRQSLGHIKSVVNKRNLWVQVHNQTSNVTLWGSMVQYKIIISEVLRAACERSQPGERIDLWCRLVNPQFLEVAITDNGQLDPQLVQELRSLPDQENLSPSRSDRRQGRYLQACQTLVTKLGGQMRLSRLEDGRTISRLIFPLAPASKSPQRESGVSLTESTHLQDTMNPD